MMMDDYRISEKLPKNAKNMVPDPTAPAILLGFAGSDPEILDELIKKWYDDYLKSLEGED